jgi:hypothetical protein
MHNMYTCIEDIPTWVVSLSLLDYNLKKCHGLGHLNFSGP